MTFYESIKYMKYLAEVCPELQFGQQSAAQLPWFHTCLPTIEALEEELSRDLEQEGLT
jgi:hypothetical protein